MLLRGKNSARQDTGGQANVRQKKKFANTNKIKRRANTKERVLA